MFRATEGLNAHKAACRIRQGHCGAQGQSRAQNLVPLKGGCHLKEGPVLTGGIMGLSEH